MNAAAAKRTVPLVASLLALLAVWVVTPAGGAQRDRVRPTAPLNPHVTHATSTSVEIAWGRSKDNVSVAGYEVSVQGSTISVKGTRYVLRDLECGTGVFAWIVALDPAGNRSARESLVAATAACSDSSAPSAPSRFTQSATAERAVVLTWQPSTDDVGVVQYGVYRELSRIATSPEPSVTLSGLSCGSTDVVFVDAADAEGNRSSRETVYVQTAPCPTVERVSVAAASIQPMAATNAQSGDDGWARCASEGQRCGFSGTADVRYGANGSWTSPRSFTDGVNCTNKVFGDPLYGVLKSCEQRGSTSSAPPTPPPATSVWSFCSPEGRTCDFAGSREVRYGAGSNWTSPRTFTNGVSCSNKVFGDPIYGSAKTCESRLPAPSAPAGDTTPPAKPVLSIGPVAQTTAVLNWQAGSDNVGIHHYNIWLGSARIGTTTNLSHQYTGLVCGTDYVLGIEAQDAAGNTSILAEARWPIRTSSCPSASGADVTPPTAPANLGITSAANTSVRLAWSPSTDNVGVAGYDAQKNGASAATVTSPTATVGSLSCGTAYQFGVEAFDAAGNRSSTSTVIGSTTACSDAQAPTIPSGLVIMSRTATSIALSWTASTDNIGVTGYGLYRDGTQAGTTTTPTGILAGLACNTNYTIGVDAYDAAGNRSPRATTMVATTACPDTTPPSTPTGLSASGITQTGLTLSWNASSDNVAVTGYDVYRGGTKMATVSATSVGQAGLACGTSYTFVVQALDAAGNRSPQALLVVSTAACPASPPASGAALVVSTTGNDSTCARGNLSKPCGTFNRAYQLAQCGDVVQVSGGPFGSQTLIENGLSSCSSNVVFQGSSSVSSVIFGSGTPASNAADHVTLKGLRVDYVRMWGDADNVVVDGIDGKNVYIEGASNVTVKNSDLGPCDSAGNSNCRNFILDPPGQATTNNILFENNTIHDFHLTVAGDHYEAFYTRGGGNVVFRGNRFWGNDTYHIRFENPRNWTLENNWFGDTCCFGGIRGSGGGSRNSALEIGGSSNVLIRYNSFAPGQTVVTEKGSVSNVRIIGNILGGGSCVPGATYAANVTMGSSCASTDRVVSALPYVNASVGSGGNYHLVAGSVAENLVSGSGSDYALSTDIDGDARSAVRDAGSDER